MENLRIAFDVDGTLINEQGIEHTKIAQLLMTLARMKNTTIIVWSGGGRDYAQMYVDRMVLGKYVDIVMAKDENFHIDIAFDDQHEFSLADKNIIVRLK